MAPEITEEARDRLFNEGGVKFSPGLIADLATLRTEGFPELHAKAFQDTAERTNCVIACRVPGADKTALIEAGYDLKSFLIKPKSCDWGPMAGFLCQLTCFNKKGSAKIDYNDENFVHYFEYLRDKCNPQSPLKPNAVRYDSQLAAAVKAGQTPFIPLKITDARKDEQLGHIPNQWKGLPNDDNPTQIVGYALDSDKTVLMEFLLNKEEVAGGEPIWGVYHGRVFFQVPIEAEGGGEAQPGEWTDFLTQQISFLDLENGTLKVCDKKEEDGRQVTAIIQNPPASLVKPAKPMTVSSPMGADGFLNRVVTAAFSSIPGANRRTFYPVNVAQNPYSPYTVREKAASESVEAYQAYVQRAENELEFYKNAVTGDYDLFAVWPVQPAVSWRDLVRLNDMRRAPAAASSVFLPVGAKPFAAEIRATPDVYIEVIPDFTEIGRYENPEIGNITNGTITVAQYLNDRITIMSKKGRLSPNASFHSDEGGRPGIDDVDYNFAVFLPSELAEVLLPRQTAGGPVSALLITSHVQFVELIGLLIGHCFVMLNHVWLTQMFTVLHPDLAGLEKTITTTKEPDDEKERDKIIKKRKKFLKERVKERKKLNDKDPGQIDTINRGLAALFLGKSRARKMLEQQPGSQPWATLWDDLIKAFTDLAIRDFDNATAQVASLMQLALRPSQPTAIPPTDGSTSPRPNRVSGNQ